MLILELVVNQRHAWVAAQYGKTEKMPRGFRRRNVPSTAVLFNFVIMEYPRTGMIGALGAVLEKVLNTRACGNNVVTNVAIEMPEKMSVILHNPLVANVDIYLSEHQLSDGLQINVVIIITIIITIVFIIIIHVIMRVFAKQTANNVSCWNLLSTSMQG